VLAVWWVAEWAVESAVEWEAALGMAWVELWEWSQGVLWCSPAPSLSSRTAVGLETKLSPTVRNPIRSRKATKSLSQTTATEEVGGGATGSTDSTS